MKIDRKLQKVFNKIKLREINVQDNSFLWKRGHLHLQDFEDSECVEKIIIYLKDYKNTPLVLFFKEDDNKLIKTLKENEKWFVGYPDQGIIWKSKTGKKISQEADNNYTEINLNTPSIIEKIINLYFEKDWKPDKTSYTEFEALKILGTIT